MKGLGRGTSSRCSEGRGWWHEDGATNGLWREDANLSEPRLRDVSRAVDRFALDGVDALDSNGVRAVCVISVSIYVDRRVPHTVARARADSVSENSLARKDTTNEIALVGCCDDT